MIIVIIIVFWYKNVSAKQYEKISVCDCLKKNIEIKFQLVQNFILNGIINDRIT